MRGIVMRGTMLLQSELCIRLHILIIRRCSSVEHYLILLKPHFEGCLL